MEILRLIILYLTVSVVVGCSSGQIMYANKQVVVPGVRNGKKLIKYTVEIEIKKEFTINELTRLKGGEPIIFAIEKLPEALYLSSYNDLKPGKYKLSFNELFNSELSSKEEQLYLKYQIKNKSKKMTLKVMKKEFFSRK